MIPSHLPMLLVFIPLCSLLLHCNQVWSMGSITYRSDSVWLLRRGPKRHVASALLSLGLPAVGSQLLCCKNTQAALERSTWQGVMAPVSGQLSEPSWKRILQPQSSLCVTIGLANYLASTSWKTLNQNNPQAITNPELQKLK